MEKVCHHLAVVLDQVRDIFLKYWWPSNVDGRDKPAMTHLEYFISPVA